MLDKITLDDIQPSSRRYPFVGFKPEREIGNDLLQVDNVSVTIDGKKILDNISFTLNKDDKVAFIANNDITTTTLFKVIMGEIVPDTGSVRWGVTTQHAYLPKDTTGEFDTDTPIVDWLRQYASKEEDDNTFLRSFLGRMLFSGDEVLKPVNVLSGGEKVRCMLSKLMLSKANVLVLDDPTNHLDLESITALNDGLMAFTGSLLFASHDHQFIQTLANRIIAVSNKGVVDRAETTYDEFLDNKDVQQRIQEFFYNFELINKLDQENYDLEVELLCNQALDFFDELELDSEEIDVLLELQKQFEEKKQQEDEMLEGAKKYYDDMMNKYNNGDSSMFDQVKSIMHGLGINEKDMENKSPEELNQYIEDLCTRFGISKSQIEALAKKFKL